MESGTQNSRDPSGERAQGPPRAPGGGGIDRKLLEEVLERALVFPNPSETVLPADMEALSEVARRHRREPFALNPVAAELVEAILRRYFEDPDHSREFWRSLSAEIAQTLFEDPVFSERLRGLWSRLTSET